MIKKFTVDNDYGLRLDVVCFNKVYETDKLVTRSQIKNAIDDGLVRVNGNIVKAGYKTKVGDQITLELKEQEPLAIKPQNIALDIVFEDENYLVINKPQGMVVHPGNGNYENTLVNALLYKYKNFEKEFSAGLGAVDDEDGNAVAESASCLRPGIVHRIDKNTSGLLVVAKTRLAFKSLSEQISRHDVKREYVALCEGVFKEQSGTITTYIARNKRDKTKMTVVREGEGKLAITHYKVLTQFNKCALVQFNLETGRTHQIRVHAKYINHPIIGDDVYGHATRGLSGQLLHARALSFVSPTTGEQVEYFAPIPSYFNNFMLKLT